MAAAEVHQTSQLAQVVVLLAAGVVAVPVFRRLGLGSVLGYLAAGLAIGPFGLRLFSDPAAILHVAELGVVMFLFIIGLEMQPSRLWNLRREIFGLGAAQVAVCGALLTGAGVMLGLSPAVAFVAGMGFVLSSTAIAFQLLDERGETATPGGQRIVSILLLEDLAIVPLLVAVAFMAPGAAQDGGIHWLNVGIAFGTLAALVAAGLWLLNPFFRLLAEAHAREVMTAAALLVVLGAALLMQFGGLSMAMGAFLAGVLLSESTFRHQLEADIDPFRGILLGLFFISVGMSLDLAVVAREWPTIAVAVAVAMIVKSVGVYGVARAFRASRREAAMRTAYLVQGGEFAFVLYTAAAAAGVFSPSLNATLTATVILSMALTPLIVIALHRLMPTEKPSLDGVEEPDGLSGSVLLIGFGRFGQVASQSLLARGIDISIVDRDVEMIRNAAEFGFKIYYGDGTRLDILHAAGADKAEAILVCVDDWPTTNRIVELCKAEFPLTKLFVRAYDREHALELIKQDVDFLIRDTFESAMAFGERVLRELGVPAEEAAETAADIRRRDAERFTLESAGGLLAGVGLLHGNAPRPTPLVKPKRVTPAGQVPPPKDGDPPLGG